MSRFYDVLRVAGRVSDKKDDNGSWVSMGFQPAEFPPLVVPPPETAQQRYAAAEPVNGGMAGEILAEGIDGHRAPTVLPETQVQVGFDKFAPLLPNIADAHVLEGYKRLRTRILQLQEASPLKTIIITSPVPQDGKTVTAVNLALSFAMIPSFRVLVVDGDLRRASLSHVFRSTDRPGLSDVLDGSIRIEDALLKAAETPVYFLPAGKSQASSVELLQVSRVGSLFRRLGECFNVVLVDSPPVNVVADTQLLIRHCDAAILVARAFKTTRKGLEMAIHELQGCRILGTVLNGGTGPGRYSAYKKYY